jgi:hypothetical protein
MMIYGLREIQLKRDPIECLAIGINNTTRCLSLWDDLYQQLIEIVKQLEVFESREEITRALDELELIHEVLTPEQ